MGKHHGEGENLFPKFTTWREQIDGQYWFPAYTKVDDELHFSTGDVHVKQVVKYTNYKRFGAKSKIIYEGQEISKDQPQSGTQQPAQAGAAEEVEVACSLFAFRCSLFAGARGRAVSLRTADPLISIQKRISDTGLQNTLQFDRLIQR